MRIIAEALGVGEWRRRLACRAARILVVIVATLPLLIVATPASATNELGWRPPSGTPVYLFRNSLTTRFYNATEWVRQNNVNPTDMTSLYASSVTGSYWNIVDNDYGNSGWSGLWSCPSTQQNYPVCNRADILFNLWSGAVPGGTYDDTEARSLACEEIGHGSRLDHNLETTRANSCLARPVSWSNTYWNNHDIGHINAWF